MKPSELLIAFGLPFSKVSSTNRVVLSLSSTTQLRRWSERLPLSFLMRALPQWPAAVKVVSIQDSWKVFADLSGLSLARSSCVGVLSLFSPWKNGAWRFLADTAQQGWARCCAASPSAGASRWILVCFVGCAQMLCRWLSVWTYPWKHSRPGWTGLWAAW